MRVTLRFRFDDGTTGAHRLFVRELNPALWPTLPWAGSAVQLGPTLAARKVSDVIFTEDGGVILDLFGDGVDNDPAPQVDALLANGYHEVLPREQA